MRVLLLLAALVALALAQSAAIAGTYPDTFYFAGGTQYWCLSGSRLQGMYSEVGFVEGTLNANNVFTGTYYEAGDWAAFGAAQPINFGAVTLNFTGTPPCSAGVYGIGSGPQNLPWSSAGFDCQTSATATAAQCFQSSEPAGQSLVGTWTLGSTTLNLCVNGSLIYGSTATQYLQGTTFLNQQLATLNYYQNTLGQYGAQLFRLMDATSFRSTLWAGNEVGQWSGSTFGNPQLHFLSTWTRTSSVRPAEAVCSANYAFMGTALGTTNGNPTGNFAIVNIAPTNGNTVSGTIRFSELDDVTVEVTADLIGLPNQPSVAIHVHQWGDVTNVSSAANTGPHWNPFGAKHGCPPGDREVGDMGSWNITAGTIKMTKVLNLLTIRGVTASIIGRAVIVHALPDSCTGAAGDAGARIGQGVIGISSANDVNNAVVAATGGIDRAIAYLVGTAECPKCLGTVWLESISGGVKVTAQITGVPKQKTYTPPRAATIGSISFDASKLNNHGFQIRTFGEVTASGPIYNTLVNNTHGLPPSTTRFPGDWGNFDVDHGGWYQYSAILPGDGTVVLSNFLGRTFSFHEFADGGAGANCGANGGVGSIWAAGVIGVQNPSVARTSLPTNIPTPATQWFDQACAVNRNGGGDNDASAGLIVGLIVAGIAAFLFLTLLVVGVIMLSTYLSRKE